MTPQDTLARLDEIREAAGKTRGWVHVPALLALVEWQRELLREANTHCEWYTHTRDCPWWTENKCKCDVNTLRKRIEEATK